MEAVEGRETWGRKLDFLLSCVGYAVGLGNLWRFPYLCMRNGGGAFLIPYLVFLFLCGMPLFFLELVLGQFSRLSPLAVWEKICPIFKGIGYGSVMVSGIMCIYYNLILAWAIYYIAMSFTVDELPWANCDNPWNTEACALRRNKNASAFNITVDTNLTAPSNSSVNGTLKPATPAEEFWHHNVLDLSHGLEDMGEFRWQLFLCLMAAWIIIFLCLFRGIKTSGKVVYVTAVAPYIMLLVFFVRGITLDGAWEGIKFYIIPDFERLLDFKVWVEACSQIFYSLGPAYGTLITMASYNRFNNNCYRDAVLIPTINCGTSIFAGFVIFSVIGFMAKQAGVDVADVATAGPGLAFVVYPEALTQLPVSQLWAIIFFFMLLMIGLDTQFGMFETMISGFQDVFPKYLSTTTRKTLFTGLMCIVQFGLGVPLVMQGGIYVFQLMDWYSATFSLMTISFMECIVVGWIYGAGQVYEDIYQMTGTKPGPWWKICWCFITPGLLLMVLIFTLVKFSQPTYGDYTYPEWAVAVGWCVAVISLIPIPLLGFHKLLGTSGSLAQRINFLFKPAADYRPSSKIYNGKETILTVEPEDGTEKLNGKSDIALVEKPLL